MPLYEFKTADGEIIEANFPLAKMPKVGSWVTIGGKRARRILSNSFDKNAMRGVRVTSYEHEAMNMPHISHGRDPAVPRYSENGFPVFRTKREIQEFQAKRPQYAWDTGKAKTEYRR